MLRSTQTPKAGRGHGGVESQSITAEDPGSGKAPVLTKVIKALNDKVRAKPKVTEFPSHHFLNICNPHGIFVMLGDSVDFGLF